ncbi:MAG: DUF1080 domain-containing protein [Verrucomicrobia bacterium]|nr:DUF1080 domain-containing protein [Verrucomicrobiota bacterium]
MRLLIHFVTLSFLASNLAAEGAFYGDPPDAHHPWAIHDLNRPQPPRVEPGTFSSQTEPGKPPSDAIVLFGGTEADLSKWQSAKNPTEPTKWIVQDGALLCVPKSGYVRTKEEFGDCQLHLEWAAPAKPAGSSQNRGNSGVFLMGLVEVQVLDNYDNPTYADGFAGSVYGINPPMVNALRKPGEWQVYDIIFRRPLFKDGQEIDPGALTVFCNGVLLQDHTPLEGIGGHKARTKPRPYPEKGPLQLQDHGNPVRYRNIWYRPLPARAVEGGTNGYLTEEAASAKKKEIASNIRLDATKLEGKAKMYRLLESLCYESNDAALKESTAMVATFLAEVKQIPPAKIESRKGDIMELNNAVQYLAKYQFIPGDFAAKGELERIIKEQGWDKKK